MFNLSGYQVGKVLGKGQQHVTYQATRESDQRQLVIKMLADENLQPEAADSLKREFEVSSQLEGPGLVQAEQLLETEFGPVIVFAYMASDSLANVLSQQQLSTEEFLDFAVQIAEVLVTVHARGFVHGDIKPSNILVALPGLAPTLIDFGMACRPAENPRSTPSLDQVEGTLAYIAPEQTGRMKRGTDFRSDLYSLGVTFYQMLAGQLPFTAEEPAALVHMHIATQPPDLISIAGNHPQTLCRLVLKLLEKDPADRYQTAAGLVHDLKELRQQFSRGRSLEGFTLGARDVQDRLRLSTEIAGRSVQLAALNRALQVVRNGGRQLVRLSGPSGSGKSALVRRFMRPSSGRTGHFITGKFEEFNRGRPYSGLIQAFEYLPKRLLAGSPDSLHQWRQQLMAELSPNARIIVDLIPAFGEILGQLPPIAGLAPKETQIRFSLTFRQFIKALVANGDPLVVFLDDMQWADGATLSLIEDLFHDRSVEGLLLITAEREEELSGSHPLNKLFSALEMMGLQPMSVRMLPLQVADLKPLLAQSLGASGDAVTDLAENLIEKTGGNPYFLHELFESLVRQGVFSLDQGRACWDWDPGRIRNQQVTDNIVDLVVERISALSPFTQKLLQVAACIGNTFDMQTVAMALGQHAIELDAAREDAIGAQVIRSADSLAQHPKSVADAAAMPDQARYRFHHDRVQQAAYQMLGDSEAAQLHLKVGNHLLKDASSESGDGGLMTAVDHLNAAISCLPGERHSELARLNLRAAHLSKSAGAYRAASRYLGHATRLLEQFDASAETEMRFDMALEAAELAYLAGNPDQAEAQCMQLLDAEQQTARRVCVFRVLILLHTSRLAYEDAIAVALNALTILNQPIPDHANPAQVLAEFAKTRFAMRGRNPQSLLQLPVAEDERVIQALDLMMLMAAPAYFVAPNLLPVIGMHMVRLSLQQGRTSQTAFGVAVFGMLHCVAFGEMKKGLEYGQVALRQASEPDCREMKPQVTMLYAGFILHWTRPLADVLPHFLEGAASAIEVGDLEYHGYCRYAHASYALMGGQTLPEVAGLLETHLAEVVTHRHEKTQRIMRMAIDAVEILRGNRAAESFDQHANQAFWSEQHDATSLAYLHKYRMLIALSAGDYMSVLDECHAMDRYQNGIAGMAFVPFYEFYKALALIVVARQTGVSGRARNLPAALKIRHRLKRWARHAPANLAHRVLLIDAELSAVNGNSKSAMQRFERAAAAALEARALHDHALILERMLVFHADSGNQSIGRSILPRVLRAYRAWGGEAFCTALEERYPKLCSGWTQHGYHAPGDPASNLSSRSTEVDLAMVARAAQVISEQVSWRAAVAEVMSAVLINSGATRALLFVPGADGFRLVSEITGDCNDARPREVPLEECQRVPLQVIRTVIHSRSSVMLDRVDDHSEFLTDPYLNQQQRLSVICAPLKRKAELVGVIYLENDLAEEAFNPGLMTTIELLSAQAAITIENARLYDELRDSLEHQVQLTTAHARFVPQEFLETLGRSSIAEVRLGDHVNIQASILYSDIRDFTPLLESLSAESGIEFINEYFEQVEPAILSTGGFVDTYLGDALLAIFTEAPDAALHAAIEMQRRLQLWNRQRIQRGEPEIQAGIGVVTGDLMLGTIGAASRLKCSVIGDTVNLAARVEGLTKRYAVPILISSGTRDQLRNPEQFLIREVDQVTVVGRAEPVTIFEVFDADPEPLRDFKQRNLKAFSHALKHYRQRALSEAKAEFLACRGTQALHDPLAEIYIERCDRYLSLASESDWDGIERHTAK